MTRVRMFRTVATFVLLVCASDSQPLDDGFGCEELSLGLAEMLETEDPVNPAYTKKAVVSFISGIDLSDPELTVAVGCDILGVQTPDRLYAVLERYNITFSVFNAFYDYYALSMKTYLEFLHSLVGTLFSPLKHASSAATYRALLRVRDSGILELDPEGLDIVGEYLYPDGQYDQIIDRYPFNISRESASVLCNDVTDLVYAAMEASSADIESQELAQYIKEYGGVDISHKALGRQLACDVIGTNSLEELYDVALSYETPILSLVRWVGEKLQKYQALVSGTPPQK